MVSSMADRAQIPASKWGLDIDGRTTIRRPFSDIDREALYNIFFMGKRQPNLTLVTQTPIVPTFAGPNRRRALAAFDTLRNRHTNESCYF